MPAWCHRPEFSANAAHAGSGNSGTGRRCSMRVARPVRGPPLAARQGVEPCAPSRWSGTINTALWDPAPFPALRLKLKGAPRGTERARAGFRSPRPLSSGGETIHHTRTMRVARTHAPAPAIYHMPSSLLSLLNAICYMAPCASTALVSRMTPKPNSSRLILSQPISRLAPGKRKTANVSEIL